MSVVIKIEWLGGYIAKPSGQEGRFVQSFDADAYDGGGAVTTTAYEALAKHFPGPAEALEFYRQTSTVRPIRPDGKPNRPLMAFTISIVLVPNEEQKETDVHK